MSRLILVGAVILAAGCGSKDPPVPAPAAPKAIGTATGHGTGGAGVVHDWPGWRGPLGDGRCFSSDIPTSFSLTHNCLWATEIPGTGYSSPVVVGHRVYLTCADEQLDQQKLLVFDRVTGRLLRVRPVHSVYLGTRHPENTYASSTPVWSGNRLFLVFVNADGLHLTAADREGSLLWQKRVGNYRASEGYGASPVVWKSLVIVSGDSSGGSTLAAFEHGTGRRVWSIDRPRLPTFGSPAIVHAAGFDQLVLTGGNQVTSYAPETGRLLWRCDAPWETACGTVCAYDDLIFCSGGVPENRTLAVRADLGLSERARIAWETNDRFYVPSLTVDGDRLFGVTDSGVAIVFDARTGTEHFRLRLGGTFFASPVLVDGLALVPNVDGALCVFRPAGDALQTVSRCEAGEGCYASPAVCDGRIYVRNRTHLVCFGEMHAESGSTSDTLASGAE